MSKEKVIEAVLLSLSLAYEVTKAIADFKSGSEEKPDENTSDNVSEDSS